MEGNSMNVLEYIAVGPLAWGRGTTIDEAVRRMRTQIPRVYVKPGYGYAVYEVGPNTEVDGLGGLSYPAAGPKPKEVLRKAAKICKS
jgi:hypothetical protein